MAQVRFPRGNSGPSQGIAISLPPGDRGATVDWRGVPHIPAQSRIIAKHDVEKLICRLDPEQGQIVRMFNIDERTQQEIASELKSSAKAIQREIKAANILMREMVH